MPAAPTPPLTGSLESAPGKPSTETSVTPFTFSSHSQKNLSTSTSSYRSHKSSSKSSHLTNSVTQKNPAKSSNVTAAVNFARTSPSTGKENNKEMKADANNPSLQSKLSIPVPSNHLELDGCKNSRARCEELNEFIKCTLCDGYLIDATTITECVHSCK